MKNYKRLSDAEREEISRMLVQDCSFQNIAKQLGRYTSTISREVLKGGCNKYAYRAAKAQNRAERNARKRKSGKFKLDDNRKLKCYVYKKLKLKWSPTQIADIAKEYPKKASYLLAQLEDALADLTDKIITSNQKAGHKT